MKTCHEIDHRCQLPEAPVLSRDRRRVQAILKTNKVVTPVEVLLRLQRITKQQHEDSRFGRIPYLSACVSAISPSSASSSGFSTSPASLGLKPSQTVYHKWGRGGKHIILRFSKSGAPALEAAYSRHYVARARPGTEDQTAATTLGATPDSTQQLDVQKNASHKARES